MGRRGWFVTLSVVLALAAGLLTPRLLAGPDSFQPRRIGPLPEAGLAPRSHHSAVWTGTQMIIWGGDDGRRTFGDGAAYDPARKTWTRLPAAPLQPRSHHSAVWTGQEMIIWGGTATPTRIRTAPRFDGAAYNPATGVWRAISRPPHRPSWLDARAAAVPGYVAIASGAAVLLYDLAADRWRAVPTNGNVYDVIAADENIVATSLVGDHYVEAAIIYRDEEGEVVDGILDEVRTRGRLVGLGATFDGAVVWTLTEDRDGSAFSRINVDYHHHPQLAEESHVWKTVPPVDGMSGPIRPAAPGQNSDHSLFWTPDGPLALTSSGIHRYVLATETVEVGRNDVDPRCGTAPAVWTGTSLLIWGGTPCGGPALGWQVTP
ncbi:hypothetical protein [Planobispora longispora]|uniref:Galactose oxidase n=1 Tax=Planobispora longispora TaxID=28887 RepID=A0A8J3RR94_9ACTN|nr:hypothetical protein [Planobispora longispora]GIH80347.1 hypothetical protein Plo01_67760 [Planobispora longispora]